MIRIATDSCSDLTVKEAKELNISLIPLTINFDTESYLDEIEMTKDEFYKRLLKTKKLPTTSQPAPSVFEELYKSAYDAGDDLIVVLLSARLSGTFSTAEMIKNQYGYKNVYLVDSANIGECIKILALEAVKYRDTLSAQEIVDKLNILKTKLSVYSVIDTLEFLHRGGRLNKAVAIVGTLLNIKPVATMRNGVVTVVSKQRGVLKGLGVVKEIIDMEGIDENYPCYIGYASCNDNCKLLAAKLFEDEKIRDEMIKNASNLSPVVGTHIGPNCAYIVYVHKELQTKY